MISRLLENSLYSFLVLMFFWVQAQVYGAQDIRSRFLLDREPHEWGSLKI